MDKDVAEALQRLEIFSGVDAAQLGVERLGGLTNRNYRIDTPHGRFVLRLAGEGTGEYIDRGVEAHNAALAAAAGVNAELLYFDEADGTMVTRFIDGGATMDATRFEDEGAVRRAAEAFARLHRCGERFRATFELFEQVDHYLDVLKGLGAAVPEGYEEALSASQAVREALDAHPLPAAPCHCDPLAENLIDTGRRMYIIDFEYSGTNDPMWDLGDLTVEAAFGPAQERAFMHAYFGGEPPAFEHGRMVLYKAMCDLLWTLWGVVQHANGNPVDDFWAYAVNRLERCRKLMGEPAFDTALAAVRRGP